MTTGSTEAWARQPAAALSCISPVPFKPGDSSEVYRRIIVAFEPPAPAARGEEIFPEGSSPKAAARRLFGE